MPKGYADSPFSDYSPQTLSALQAQNAARLRMAFAANNGASGQYLASQPASSINVLSCHPSSGSSGTKVSLKVTSQYDLGSGAMTASSPFVSIVFGSQRCSAQIHKDSEDGNGTYTYTATADAPQFLSTGCPSLSNVPLTLLVEGPNGEGIARVDDVGSFSYHNAQTEAAGGSVGVSGPGDTSPPDLGSPRRSPVQRTSPPHQSLQMQASTSNSSVHPALPPDAATNTYGFPPGVSTATAVTQAPDHTHSDYSNTSATGYHHGSGSSMLGSYRTTSFSDPFSRMPPVLRSPHGTGWTPFGSQLESMRGSAANMSPPTTTPNRRGLTPLHHPTSASVPRLVRTSTLNQPGSAGGGYTPYPGLYQTKAELKISGDLGSMAENWTQEEWSNKRRLVLFSKHQAGNELTTTFRPVSVAERPPNSICISCIWWAEKNECFVTSVDTIHLLEQLVVSPARFTVEEKNRIRRNLEGFHPLTVGKQKAESEEFFKVIMGFGNPKPRNIEKDVKVFPWKTLAPALKKIIGKYSASLSSIETPTGAPHVSPGNINSSYPLLPPTPNSASSTSASESTSAASYLSTSNHHHAVDSITSPRQLPGVSTWPAYGATTRTMSPVAKHATPVSAAGHRISTLTAYDSRGAMQNLTSPYSISGSSSHHSPHHNQGAYSQPAVPVSQSHARSWSGYSVADGYATPASHSHGQVYDGGPYGDGTQRA